MASELVRIITLLYSMQSDDIRELEADLLEQRKQVWLSALREKAREYGCNQSPNAPRLTDLTELKAMSKDDATSIAATWKRDAERKVQALYDANPKGNRNYYYRNMEIWATERDSWKSLQIALMTAQTTRFYAQSRFRAMNGLRGRGYIFVGPTPVCEVCVTHFAAGVVDERYVQRNPAPVHIGCPHEWREAVAVPIPCATMWVG